MTFYILQVIVTSNKTRSCRNRVSLPKYRSNIWESCLFQNLHGIHLSAVVIDKKVPCLTICVVCDLQPVSMLDFLCLEHCIQILNADNGFWTSGLWNEKHHCIKVLSGRVMEDRLAVWELDPYWRESRHPKISEYWIYLKYKALITCYIKWLTKSDSLSLTNARLQFERDVSELLGMGSISSLIVGEQLATLSHRRETCWGWCCSSWWENILVTEEVTAASRSLLHLAIQLPVSISFVH